MTAVKPGSERRRERDVPVPDGFDARPYLSGLGAQLAGTANVVMQLGRPGVGYGVLNSRVHDGSAMRHPVKRARTTFTYLGVAMLGDDDDRAAFRKAVNGQHAQVVSTPDEPEQYRAMDPDLQLWVAACLYYGTRDIVEKMHRPLPREQAEGLYAYCARFGTTLQVPRDAWPADLDAFDAYWQRSLTQVRIDPPVREYLLHLIELDNLPRAVRPLARGNVFVTTGFLPPLFREQLGLSWTPDQQRRFEDFVRRVGRLERVLPGPLRRFPLNALLLDMRRRRRAGRRLV